MNIEKFIKDVKNQKRYQESCQWTDNIDECDVDETENLWVDDRIHEVAEWLDDCEPAYTAFQKMLEDSYETLKKIFWQLHYYYIIHWAGEIIEEVSKEGNDNWDALESFTQVQKDASFCWRKASLLIQIWEEITGLNKEIFELDKRMKSSTGGPSLSASSSVSSSTKKQMD